LEHPDRKLVAAVGIERWGQRAGLLAPLLEKHTVAVNSVGSRGSPPATACPEFDEEMNRLDEKLNILALDAQAQGLFEPPNLK
jgi:hypothetical protein